MTVPDLIEKLKAMTERSKGVVVIVEGPGFMVAKNPMGAALDVTLPSGAKLYMAENVTQAGVFSGGSADDARRLSIVEKERDESE